MNRGEWAGRTAGWLRRGESQDSPIQDQRSQDRYRRALLAGGGALMSRGLHALSLLISVPLTLRHLGVERYGLWVSLSSLIASLHFMDLGIGNGLVTSLAKANGREDREEAAQLVSSAFFLMVVAASLLGCLGWFLGSWISWPELFQIRTTEAMAEVTPTLAAFLFFFLLSLPLNLIERIRVGYQEGGRHSLWQMGGTLAGLVGLGAAVYRQVSLPWLVVAMLSPPAIVTLVQGADLLLRQRRWLLPSWQRVDRGVTRRLLRLGGVYFLLQLLTVLGVTVDPLIIAYFHGPEAVASFSVVQRLFFFGFLSQHLLSPLWPAYGEAFARQDWRWVRQALSRSIQASLILGTFSGIVLWVGGETLVRWWVGAALLPSPFLLSGFALYSISGAVGGALTLLLNQPGLIRGQLLIYLTASLVALGLKLVLTFWGGPAGAVWATVLGYGIFFLLPGWWLIDRFLGEQEGPNR
ncbi:MAG: lipopolysaccharide biosynthesis protein [Blastocatellia bacterium]